MDFFQQQEVARKKTGLLIFYFVATVAGLVGAIYAAMAGIFLGVGGGERGLTSAVDNPATLWDPALFGLVSAGTLGVIGVGTLYRVASLAGGGRVVAEMLQGRLIAPDTTDPTERKVLNVVEEMAIASGVPVPPVYLMDHEPGINAFAAGHKPGDAVIGVTRGTVENLSRAELQGVIAHEFSHILNGDMKLNLRLMGILFGILAISMIGYFILRATTGMRLAARDDGKKGANPLPLIGLALYVLGYVGLIGGRLIKSAISRQREYLADASAVQFTRDPSGIADALKKIGALSGGSRIRAEEAEEASHMFFGNAMGASLFGLMATHPPLVDRIRRLEPSFDGDFDAVRLAIEKGQSLSAAAESKAPAKERTRLPFDPVGAIGRIGTLDPARVAAAAAMLDSMPKGLGDHAREPFGARALVFALLLDRDEPDLRQNQLANLRSTIDPKTFELTESLVPAAIAVPAEQRLPLVELALPALRRLSAGQYREFKGAVERLMAADRRLDLFEFALQRMILRHLGTQFERGEPWPGTVKTDQPGPLIRPMLALLGAVAQSGDRDPAKAGEAFRVGLDALGWGRAGGPGASYPLLDRAALPGGPVGLREVREALDVLAGASPALKKDILRACATAIALDGSVTVEEGELLRAISDTLDCPMPPLGGA
jgi:Zn-dependent protease with chaperone function